jgi:hypothetical protein
MLGTFYAKLLRNFQFKKKKKEQRFNDYGHCDSDVGFHSKNVYATVILNNDEHLLQINNKILVVCTQHMFCLKFKLVCLSFIHMFCKTG